MAFSAVANDIPDRLTKPRGEHVYIPERDKLYEDSAATTQAAIDGPVGAWEDESGNHTATQSTTANKPTLRQDVNGRLYVEFAANEDFLETTVSTTDATKASTIPGVGAFSAQVTPGNKSRTNARIQSTTAGAIVKEGTLTSSHRAALANAIDQRGKDIASGVTSFRDYFRSEPFTSYDAHAQDTSSVTDMGVMFYNTSVSDLSPLSGWDTSQVDNMSNTFRGTSVSDLSPLSNWDTSKVTNMGNMFPDTGVSDLSPLSGWDTGQVKNITAMFRNTGVSDLSPLSGWDMSSVTDMSNMFRGTSVSDLSPLSNWDTSQVEYMSNMFRDTGVSDLSPLSAWDTGQVLNMFYMFQGTSVSDLSPLSGWDTSQVEYMGKMFYNTSVSDPSTISGWDVGAVTNFTAFLQGAPLDDVPTGDMLAGWTDGSPNTATDMQSGVTLGIQNADYSNMDSGGQNAVDALCSDSPNWTINATNAPADCS